MEKTDISDGSVRLGIDFGSDSVVIVRMDPDNTYSGIALQGISRPVAGVHTGYEVHEIPAAIRYNEDGSVSYGCEVIPGAGENDPTASCLRDYLLGNSPVQFRKGTGAMVRYADAARDFLGHVLLRAVSLCPTGTDLVFSIPDEASEGYREVLKEIGYAAGARSCLWVSECSAAAEACDVRPESGGIILIFSFTTPAMSVTLGLAGDGAIYPAGHVSLPVGCRTVDTWLAQDLLRQFRIHHGDARAERIRNDLIREASRARTRIPADGSYAIEVTDPARGRTYSATVHRAWLARILEKHGLESTIQETLDRALQIIGANGFPRGNIGAVILAGPGCALPGVEEIVRQRFPEIPVHDRYLVDGIARGAAGHSAPASPPDRIMNTYAIRYWDPGAEEHRYRFLVHAGTRFPSQGQVARITISAAYDGQTHLGIPLCGISSRTGGAHGIELVADHTGGIRIAGPGAETRERDEVSLLNEQNPTLLTADPPAKKGEPRFECTFTIDRKRNLCLSARDLMTGALVKMNTPVYRMT